MLTARPQVDSRFLSWFAQSDPFIEEVVAHSVGVSYPAISPSDLARLPVPTLDLPAQRAIAEFLDAETARIDALIAKKCKLVQLLETRFQREIDHVMDSFDSSEAALGRFVLELGQGSSLQAGSRPADGEEWGVLKLSAVKFGRYDPRENKVLAKQPEELPMVPQVGDLLVTRSNTPAYVGDVAAVVHTTARNMLPDLIYRLRLDSARMSAEFVSYTLPTSRSRHRISALARGSSQSMVKLRGEDIRSLPVPVVTPSVQERTVASLERRRRQKSEISSKLDQQIALLVEHRQALITAAVTGEIGVPEVAVLHGLGR
ncbi:MAG: hypothetical protein H0X19_01225 [Rubrobacter sp.]|nr:hypothetical protein [Rubrobacter sp.]